MKVEQFGSKFFLGKLCRNFEEPPLHFLQGIWGSAFCILFKRLFEDNRKLDPVEMIRQNISDELDKKQECSSTDSSDSEEETEDNDSRRESNDSIQSDVTMMSDGSCVSDLDKDLDAVDNFQPNFRRNSQDNILDVETARRNAFESLNKCIAPDDTLNDLYEYNDDDDEEEEEKKVLNCRLVRKNGRRYRHKLDRSEVKRKQSTKKEYGFWRKVMIGLVENKNIEILSTRAGRAGIVHNPMRGLSLQKLYPLSPFTQIPPKEHFSTPDEFDGNFEMHSTEIKKLYMVDAGLTFNSPYPLVLRPQRAVSLILSFDFSARPSDDHPPFYVMNSLSLARSFSLSRSLSLSLSPSLSRSLSSLRSPPLSLLSLSLALSPLSLSLALSLSLSLSLSLARSLSPSLSLARSLSRSLPRSLSHSLLSRSLPISLSLSLSELLLAEKWARINNIPFPPIDTSVFEKEGMKELYVFRNPNDPYCPVVMHFVLCNKTFREFKAPGVPRETPEEKEFANFSIFEDPAAPYSTFNFKYSHLAFDRLAKLTEFNTLLHVEEIKKCIAEQIELKRFLPTRVPVDSKNVKHLPIKDVNRQAILKNYLRHIKNRNSADVAELERKYSMNGTPPSTSSPMERSKKLSFCLPSRHVNRYSCQSIYFDALDLSEGEDQDDSSDESLPFHSPLTGPSPTDLNEFA
ncbi:PLA2G4 [Acanthosepion pharaonis]|uniref:PLA2G4 n=1 Tax=Acanthosepion pharaonis TaxID=158019 RepID=A0A812DUU7_ACAPH|nr:PLA2G4 [Sepia pharaonis]